MNDSDDHAGVDGLATQGQTDMASDASVPAAENDPIAGYDFGFNNGEPTAVIMGNVDLTSTGIQAFLRGIGASDRDAAGLLALLDSWDPVAAAHLQGAGRDVLLGALRDYLDPDADGEVVLFRWETLEERGTVGFYVERRASGSNWMRVNANLLPAMVAAPMGAEYVLADPGALADIAYDYRLIELEARGTTREYGPFRLQARD